MHLYFTQLRYSTNGIKRLPNAVWSTLFLPLSGSCWIQRSEPTSKRWSFLIPEWTSRQLRPRCHMRLGQRNICLKLKGSSLQGDCVFAPRLTYRESFRCGNVSAGLSIQWSCFQKKPFGHEAIKQQWSVMKLLVNL